jgi:hypothetical protein
MKPLLLPYAAKQLCKVVDHPLRQIVILNGAAARGLSLLYPVPGRSAAAQ